MPDFSFEGLRALLREKMGSDRYSDQIDRSLRLAFEGHRGQFREHMDNNAEKIPYIVHPVGVALLAVELLPLAGLSEKFDDIISACLTHDLLEDSNISIEVLANTSSKRAANIVASLTKPTISSTHARSERNKRIVQQIISGGRAAMFVKICDYLHNISRPRQSPKRLLDKAISRGKLDYLRFFDDGYFDGKIREVFLSRIASAERERANLRIGADTNDVVASNLDEAIARCFSLARNKVLELHDIIEALSSILHPMYCDYERIDDFIESRLGVADISRNERRKISSSLREGHLMAGSHKELSRSKYFSNISDVFATPLEITAFEDNDRRIFLSFAKGSKEEWINIDALKAIILVLSERLRTRANLRISELSLELRNIGLDLNPNLAIRSDMSFEQFAALKSLIDACNYVHDTLHLLFRQSALTNEADLAIERIESRVKTADSIVEKLITRRYKNIEEMDDLVGFRIICSSRSASKNIVDYLVKFLKGEASSSLFASAIDGAVEVENITSVAGYRASHIRFAVILPPQGQSLVRCEIQVRTIFQDAWARLSQLALYKKRRNNNKTQKLFDELSDVCEAADRVVDNL